MSSGRLLVGLTTASFLPWTAWRPSAIDRVVREARRLGFYGVEVLATRAALVWRGRDAAAGAVLSVHEAWNPRDTVRHEVMRIVRRRPQCRGMTPHPMDALFFANGEPGERWLLTCAGILGVPAVVSCLHSPFGGSRYSSPRAAVQVHPDLGPDGAHLDLDAVSAAVESHDYGVVFDTYHTRRRARRHPRGRTEIAPPVAASGEPSLGGLRNAWARLGNRVALVHFQPAHIGELRVMLDAGRLPDELTEFRPILPACAGRGIPLILEISPRMASALGRTMTEILERARDVLVREAETAAR